MRLLIAIALLFGLAACASVSREECLAGNWEEIGFRDGTNGQFSSYIQQHVKACQKVEVTPDPVAWETQIDQSQRLLIAEENPAVRAALVREQRSLNREINLLQLRQRPFASL